MNNRCKICHCQISEGVADRRCKGCRDAKAATDAGLTYGKYMGYQANPDKHHVIPVPVVIQEPKAERQRCPVCGKEVEPNRRFCRPECYQAYHLVQTKKKEAEKRAQERAKKGTLICKWCGKEITSTSRRIYCSAACADAARQHQANEAQAARRAKIKAKEGGRKS